MFRAQALVAHDEKKITLETVTMPAPGKNQLRIRTLYSGISVGTEFALIKNRISWGPYPLITGYQAVGEVEEVGATVEGYRAGDRVYYRANHAQLTLSSGAVCSNVSATHTSHA
ncbi:MAG: alcohol dehydrogenase catalytic domain-containing protein, partial [Rariglobus sp.]